MCMNHSAVLANAKAERPCQSLGFTTKRRSELPRDHAGAEHPPLILGEHENRAVVAKLGVANEDRGVRLRHLDASVGVTKTASLPYEFGRHRALTIIRGSRCASPPCARKYERTLMSM